jgi:hypothetical protein
MQDAMGVANRACRQLATIVAASPQQSGMPIRDVHGLQLLDGNCA